MQRRARGYTLIELIVAITVVAICVTTVLAVMASVASRSADAVLEQQAVAIAQAYLDEIEQRWIVDPNPTTPPNTGRGSWDLLSEYNGLSEAPHDQSNTVISQLSQYAVSVSVVASSGLGGIAGASACTGAAGAKACRIDVTVTTTPNVSVTLSGYRTQY